MIVAILARVSSQRQEQEETVATQLAFLKKWADLHGHSIVEYYTDEAVSGTIKLADRPEGSRLIRDAASPDRKWEAVVVYRLDRLGRSVEVVYEALNAFEAHDIAFVSATEPFDTSTAVGKMFVGFLALFAEFEKETIRQRCRDGKLRVAGEGTWIGGRPPYGYRLEEKRLVVDPETAAIVQELFVRYLRDGSGLAALAYDLSSRSVPCPSAQRGEHWRQGRRWHASTIRDILTNTIYKGVQYWGKVQRPLPEARLVTDVEWAAVNARLKENQYFNTYEESPYLLTGLIHCHLCGRRYTATRWKNGKSLGDRHVYVCRARLCSAVARGHGVSRCPAPYLDGAIDQQILADCRAMLEDPARLTRILKEQHASDSDNAESLKAEIHRLQSARSQLTVESDRLLTLYQKGRLDEERWSEREEEVANQKLSLSSQIAAIELRLASVAEHSRHLSEIEIRLRDMREGRLSERQIVRGLVHSVVVEERNGHAHAVVSYWPEESVLNTSTKRTVEHTIQPLFAVISYPLAARTRD